MFTTFNNLTFLHFNLSFFEIDKSLHYYFLLIEIVLTFIFCSALIFFLMLFLQHQLIKMVLY